MYRIKLTKRNRRLLTAFSPLLIKKGYTPIYNEKKDIVEFIGEKPLNIAEILLEELETLNALTLLSIIKKLANKGITAKDVDEMFGYDRNFKIRAITDSNKLLVYPAMLGAAIYLVRKYLDKEDASSLLREQYINFYNSLKKYNKKRKLSLSDIKKLLENLLFSVLNYKRALFRGRSESIEKNIKMIMSEYEQLYKQYLQGKNIANSLMSPSDIIKVIDSKINRNFSSPSKSSNISKNNSTSKQNSQTNNKPSQEQTKKTQSSHPKSSISNSTNEPTKTSETSTQSTSKQSPEPNQTISTPPPKKNQTKSSQTTSNQPPKNNQTKPPQTTSPSGNLPNPPQSEQNIQNERECRTFSYVIKDQTRTYEICGSKEKLDAISEIHEQLNNLGKILSHKRVLFNTIHRGYVSDKNLNDMLDKLKEIPGMDNLHIRSYTFEYSPTDLTKAEVNEYNSINASLTAMLQIDKAQNQTAKLIVSDLRKVVEKTLETGEKIEEEETIDEETKKKIKDIIIYLSEMVELRNKLDEELEKLKTIGTKLFTVGGKDFYDSLKTIAEKNEYISENDSSALEIYEKIRDLNAEIVLLQEELDKVTEEKKNEIKEKIRDKRVEIRKLLHQMTELAKTGASKLVIPLKKAIEKYNEDLDSLKKSLFTVGMDKNAIEYSLKKYSDLLAARAIGTAEDITGIFQTIKQDYEEIIGRQLLLLSYYTQTTDIVLTLDKQLYTHFKLAYYTLSWGQNTWSALGIAVKTVWDYIFRKKKASLTNLIKVLLRNLARDNGVIVAIEKSGKRRWELTESWNIKNFFKDLFNKIKTFFNKHFGWIKIMKKQLQQQNKETEELINKLYTTLVESVVYGVRLNKASSKYLLISPQKIGLVELPERTERIFRETNFNKPVKWKPLTKRYYKYFLSKYFLALTEELSEFDTIPESLRVEMYYNTNIKKGILQYKFYPSVKSKRYPAILLKQDSFNYFYKKYKRYWEKMYNGYEEDGVVSYAMVLTERKNWIVLYAMLKDLKRYSSAQIETPFAAQAIREEIGLLPPNLYELV